MNKVNSLALAACRLVNTPEKMAEFVRKLYADARAHEREQHEAALKGATVIANHARGIIKELETKLADSEKENRRLRTIIGQVNSINDDPACFNVRIDKLVGDFDSVVPSDLGIPGCGLPST